eukprot:6339181-Pyramimonas_sp.AAC.1
MIDFGACRAFCNHQRFEKKSRAKSARSKSQANAETASGDETGEGKTGEATDNLPQVGDLVEYVLSEVVKNDLQ